MLILKLASRNLLRNTRRTVLTSMLIAFSLTALIMTDGLVLGMSDLMVGSITRNLAGEAQLHKTGFRENYDTDLYLSNSRQLVQQLNADPDIREASPRVLSGGMISSSYNVSTGLIYGIDAATEARLGNLSLAVIEGRFLTGNSSEIMLGKQMADLLEVSPGDRIVITLSEVNNGQLAQALFRVSGIFYFGLREIDENVVFVNLDKAREILGMTPEQSHEIVVLFQDSGIAKNSNNPVFERYANPEIEFLGWLDLNKEIATMIEMSNYSSFIVGMVLFLLASLGVINSMFMSIYERIYEFGVAKAIGTRPADLSRLILCEAFLVAIISCVAGLVLSLILGYYTSIYGIPMGEFEVSGIALTGNIKTLMSVEQFTLFPLYVVILTLVAAIYPARFAANIIPTEALHRSL